MLSYHRFSDVSVSERILNTMFLITIGLGYMFALGHTYYSHQGRDGEAGLSVEDVKIAYYGKHQQTRLGAALNGSMGSNLELPAQKKIITDWIENGTDQAAFHASIAPIFNNHCIACHSSDTGMGLPALDNYEDVLKLTSQDTGASIESLVRVSHIHLFGIAFILFFVGRIFILCEIPPIAKRITVAIPFIAILIDIMSWYITKAVPGFAYVVVITGGLMGLSLSAQILISLYQMWLYKPKPDA